MNTKSKVIVIDSYKNSDKQLKVGAYVRVSTNSEDQLNSYRTQLNYYQDYIQSNENWILVDIYADEGISGRSIKKRTEFNRMLDDCRKNKLDRILVKSISRFARNTKESLEVTRELKSLGVTIFFEKENIDTAKATDEFLFTLFSQIAQEESASHSKNMIRSYISRMEQGKFITCKAPFGYELVNGTLQIKEDEAEIVRYIFNSYLNGVSRDDIAKELTESEFDTGGGNYYWTGRSVGEILSNEKHMGDSLSQKKYVTDDVVPKRVRNKGERPKYYIRNNHQAIISRDIFERAKALSDTRNVPVGSSISSHPFSRKIFCSKCGRTLKLRRVNNVNYRACRNHDKDSKLCSLGRIRESEINNAFVRMFNKLQLNKNNIIEPMIKELKMVKEKISIDNQAIVTINKEIADIMEQLNVIADMKNQGYIDEDFYISQLNEYNTRLSELKKEKVLLVDTKFDEIISASNRLLELLESEPIYIEESNKDLFLSLIKKVIVISETEIKFILVNGMHLTENIERTVR